MLYYDPQVQRLVAEERVAGLRRSIGPRPPGDRPRTEGCERHGPAREQNAGAGLLREAARSHRLI